MFRQTRYCSFLLLAACAWGGCKKDAPPPELADKRAAEATAPIGADRTQLVTVVSKQWDDFRATLRRFERTPQKRWKSVGPSVEVVLGREGYGWGRGLHGTSAPPGRPGPIKNEGDGRSPAGVFGIGNAYGYEPRRDDLSLPYAQASDELRCVDDPQSRHYNQIVSTEDTEPDWQSAEHMRREDEMYVLTIVVEHNTAETKPRAGSCIFIHLWEGPDKGMSGCTAMPMDALEALAAWLRPGAVLVSLPRAEYEALERPWGLPAAPQLGARDSQRSDDGLTGGTLSRPE